MEQLKQSPDCLIGKVIQYVPHGTGKMDQRADSEKPATLLVEGLTVAQAKRLLGKEVDIHVLE